MRALLEEACQLLAEAERMECESQRDRLLLRLRVFKAQMLLMEVLLDADETA